MTGLTSSSVRTRSPIITSAPPVPFVSATQPPKPNGVGAGRCAMVTFRSSRGIFTFSTPSLKSPLRPSVVSHRLVVARRFLSARRHDGRRGERTYRSTDNRN